MMSMLEFQWCCSYWNTTSVHGAHCYVIAFQKLASMGWLRSMFCDEHFAFHFSVFVGSLLVTDHIAVTSVAHFEGYLDHGGPDFPAVQNFKV